MTVSAPLRVARPLPRPPIGILSISPGGWVAVVAVLLGAALRFSTLGTQSFWFDEAQLAHEVRLSLGGLFSTLGDQETSPPLYFGLAWLWAKLFGAAEVGLRSLSAIAGTATIAVAYLCGRELVSRGAGAVTAVFVALSPFMIWYSQEAREYMLLVFLTAGSLLFFARSLRGRSSREVGWWAVLSILALLTHFYAGFLIGPEAALLLWRHRVRGTATAVVAVAAVQAALLPLAISDTGHPIGWISALPLSTRVQQVPVAFALNTLYQSPAVNLGLVAAAVVLAAVIVLLVGGADARRLRGAAMAGGLGGFVVLVPLVIALLGHDYYIARALIGAWVPLAVVLAAACTVPRWQIPGAALAAVMMTGFLYAGVKIDSSPRYQRPDWRAVAGALGASAGSRAIVAYDGSLATDPLAIYLPRVRWHQSGQPVSVSEVDVVASSLEQLSPLPAGVRLLARQRVAGFVVIRLRLDHAWHLTRAQIGARAGTLLGPAPSDPAVLIQPGDCLTSARCGV